MYIGCSVVLILVCSVLLSNANSGGVRAVSLANLCSNIEIRELASTMEPQNDRMTKRAAMWFGPRMGKRGSNLGNPLEQDEALPEELLNTIREYLKLMDSKLGPNSGLTMYLVKQQNWRKLDNDPFKHIQIHLLSLQKTHTRTPDQDESLANGA